MVATELLKLAMETEEERKERLKKMVARVENILTLGKLLSLWFCFLLHSILFLISQTSYRTYKIISRYELPRPIMGTIFLVNQRWMIFDEIDEVILTIIFIAHPTSTSF